MKSDNRKYPRAPLTGSVKFYEWDQPRRAHVSEISGGGIFLRTAALLPEGTLVTLRVEIPGNVPAFTVLGKVVRTVQGNLLRSPGMGVHFVDIRASDRQKVLDYVEQRMLRAA